MAIEILADENGSKVGGRHVGGNNWLKSEAFEVKAMAKSRQEYFCQTLRQVKITTPEIFWRNSRPELVLLLAFEVPFTMPNGTL